VRITSGGSEVLLMSGVVSGVTAVVVGSVPAVG